MLSGPQQPSSTPRDLSGTDADLALYREKFRQRLPESLEELHGPTQGVVELPLHVAWSGMTSYDLGKPRQRMAYTSRCWARTCKKTWPPTSTTICCSSYSRCCALWSAALTVRTVWEDAFPQPASRAWSAV